MKTNILKIVGLFIFFLTLSAEATTLSSLDGNWKNISKSSRGITKMIISAHGKSADIRVFGSCRPKNCKWGKKKLYPYGKSVSSNVKKNLTVLTATYKKKSSEVFLVLKIVNKRLEVESFTRFTDKSKRSNYMSKYTFVRSYIKTPKMISPRNNQVFKVYPRKTKLKWSKVKGAKSYVVEIDCINCCKKGKWCLDVKKKAWKQIKTKKTSYTFNYVGAQFGRWRVWAIDSYGKRSKKSGWRIFKYTK